MPRELKGEMNGQGLQVGVIVARFNEIITRKLLDSAVETLIRYGVKDEDITVERVPIERAKKLVRWGEIEDAKTVAALYMAMSMLDR